MSVVDYNDEGEWVTADGRVCDVSFDWKASPAEVIEAVNAALKGLFWAAEAVRRNPAVVAILPDSLVSIP